MKFFIIFIILASSIILMFYPYIMKEKTCYDQTQKEYETINFNIQAKGWGQEEVCSRRTDVIMDLEDCVKKATASGGLLTTYGNPFIGMAVFLVRPLTKGIETLKGEHNKECSSYYKYQF